MRYYLLMIMALMVLPAMAQANRIYIEDFEIDPDSTVTVPVMLANEDPTRGIQFNMSLPQGLILKKTRITEYSSEYSMSLTCRYSERENYYLICLYPSAPICYDPDTAAVMTVTFAAEPDFKGGTISLWKCRGSTINNKSFVIDDATTNVTVPVGSLIGVPIDNEPVRDEFFNLMGQPVSSPDSVPVAIHVTIAVDGHRTCRKVATCH